MTPEECRLVIQANYKEIEEAYAGIDEIARKHIEDFTSMRHSVSTFWRCKESPIGMCVFDLLPFMQGYSCRDDCLCRYCGDPMERK